MTQSEKELVEIVNLQDSILSYLVSFVESIVDIENLPCMRLIEQVDELKSKQAELVALKNKQK